MKRDLRDPTALGEALLHLRSLAARFNGNKETLSGLYDLNKPYAPDYDGSNDIHTVTPVGAKH